MREDKKNKDIKSIVEGKLDNYGITKKSIYATIGIIGCLFLVVVMSITGTDFKTDVFVTWNYWITLMIQYGIAIFSMITGRSIGDDTQRNKPNGQYRRELKNYSDNYARIDKLGIYEHFEKWLVTYRERKRQKKIADILRDWHISQSEVLDLDIAELPNLSSPWKKNWENTQFYEKYLNHDTGKSETIFRSLTDEQIEVLRQIMNGKVQVPNVDASYFLNALKGTSVDEWERAAKADKKKGAKVVSGFTYRLIMMLAISVALNGLIPAPYEDTSVSTVFLDLAKRLFTMISSTIYGIFLGIKVVEMDIVFLGYKSLILKTYGDEYENGTFRPETVEEQARREYEEAEEKRKKAIESVVVPETDDVPLLEETPSSVIIAGEGQ